MNEEKSFALKYIEARNQIVASVNAACSNGIPYYLLETILSDVFHQVQYGASNEIENALKQAENKNTEPEKTEDTEEEKE